MTQKLFLTSALAMGVMAPAMAEPERIATFPNAANNEFMQENKVYTNAATAENMDNVYEDGATVDAVAEYTDILYNIVAGNYLEAGSDDVNGTQCPQNSYCPGLTDALYNATTDQGINSCPSEYGLSAAGASSQNDCYRTCTNADVEHSTGTMNGWYYYGNNNQCEPTACVNGYHKKDGLNLETEIGTVRAVNRAYVVNNKFEEANYNTETNQETYGTEAPKGQSYYGITSNNTWAVDYGSNGMLYGQARCSNVSGTAPWNASSASDVTIHTIEELGAEGGNYCYCNVTGYKASSSSPLQSLSSSSWMYNVPIWGGTCTSSCASECTIYISSYGAGVSSTTRSALLGTVAPSLAMCEANTININWYNADAEDVSANNAGTATYGSDVRTPVKAQTIKGKTFRGWRFSKPTETNLP